MLTSKTVLIYDREFLIALDIDRIVRARGALATVIAHSWDDTIAVLRGGTAINIAIIDFDAGVHEQGATLLDETGVGVLLMTGDRGRVGGVPEFAGSPVVLKPYTEADIESALTRLTG